MEPTHVRTPRAALAALFGGGALMLLLAGWSLVPAGALTPERATLPAAGGTGRPTLVVVFQPDDCLSYSQYLEQWNALWREGEVPVVGVPLNAAGRGSAKPVLDYFTPEFPLREELGPAAAAMLRRMGQSRSPVAVLLDPAGRPRMVVPPGSYTRENVLSRMAVRDYARAMFRSPTPRDRS